MNENNKIDPCPVCTGWTRDNGDGTASGGFTDKCKFYGAPSPCPGCIERMRIRFQATTVKSEHDIIQRILDRTKNDALPPHPTPPHS